MIKYAEEVTGKKALIDQLGVPPGDVNAVGHPSYGRIEEVLGWVPKVDVKEGMRLYRSVIVFFRRFTRLSS